MYVQQAPWHNDVVLDFLEGYRSESALWDPKHPYHKNKYELNSAWERIQATLKAEKGLDLTIDQLKRKKESIMTAYRLHVRKLKANPDYTTNWFAFDFMHSFLEDVYLNAEGDKSMEEEDSNKSDHNRSYVEKERPNLKRLVSRLPSKSTPSKQTESVKYTYKREPRETYARSSAIKSEEMDECDLYAQLLAKKLRRLDERQRNIVMHEIDNIMFRASMNSSHRNFESPNNFMRKIKSPGSPVFVETDQNGEQYEEEYLEDPIDN